MTVELSAIIERELRDLAMIQSRDISEIVEEAVRQYLEASAITDLDVGEIVETQAKMSGELQDPPRESEEDPEERLAHLVRQGLLRRATAPLPREILMEKSPQAVGSSALETLLADRRDGGR